MTPTPAKSAPKKPTGGARSASRLAAVQALYQLELGDGDADSVIQEFVDHRIGREVEGDLYADADAELFRDIVKGVTGNAEVVDAMVSGALTPDWPLGRLEAVLRAILRAGAYELKFRVDVPAKVAINEYMDIAHAFFGGSEPGLVNGVLDRLSREVRGGV